MDGQALRILLAERFVCPRCKRQPLLYREGDDLSPVCDPCWADLTNGGQNPIPKRWRYPSDGGPDLPPESAGTVLGVHT